MYVNNTYTPKFKPKTESICDTVSRQQHSQNQRRFPLYDQMVSLQRFLEQYQKLQDCADNAEAQQLARLFYNELVAV